jgi:hypothetical protein
MRQCAQGDCSDILGTKFQRTTGKYTFTPTASAPDYPPDLPFEQVIELSGAEHKDFNNFLVGFTTAAGADDDQQVDIRDFQLDFIQVGDEIIDADDDWKIPLP